MKRTRLLDLADRIEKEMKKLNLWSSGSTNQTRPTEPFGGPSLSFEKWLQFIFLPNLRKAGHGGSVPSSSEVATAAIRNLDGVADIDNLLDLLSTVDKITKEIGPL